MDIVHISKLKRSEGHLGGVEKFASHLKRAFPELEMYGSDDVSGAGGSDLRIAKALNAHLLETGLVGGNTVVVSDGFWQAGLSGKVRFTINVSHGTWIGIALANEFVRFGSTSDFLKLAKWQEAAYRAADVIVAVSPLAAWELRTFYNLDSVLIYNGVDTDVFYPAEEIGSTVLHVAAPGRKQLSMVEETAGVLARPIEYLNVKTGSEEDEANRWREGRVFFQPSAYEGCSYASLEAMACGLVPVSFRTGLFWDLPDWAAVAEADHFREVYARAIEIAFVDYKNFRPREWVEENASMDRFIGNWRKLVGGIR